MSVFVLIVGNDKATTTSYAGFFAKKEFNVLTGHSGRQALVLAKAHRLDAVVVDATSPRLNCKSLCKRLRAETFAPIVLITQPNGKVESGIAPEAVVPKPVAGRKLVARVKSAIESKPPRLLIVGHLSLDLEKHKLTRGNKSYPLTPKEFILLKLLMTRAGQTVTRKTLMKEVWETDYLGDTRTLDVHIRWVREKVEENPSKPRLLVTARGQGYKLQDGND
ncbi:MAG: response regulator transcription factor [Chloroflexi bacterium]|nr:response regulator transcription factor [Chloroflexota bacterium]